MRSERQPRVSAAAVGEQNLQVRHEVHLTRLASDTELTASSLSKSRPLLLFTNARRAIERRLAAATPAAGTLDR
jgi:hypothetical protein